MIEEHWLAWIGVVSILVFLVSLAALPWIVAPIPADYFCHSQRTPAQWKSNRPSIRILLLIAKNLLGYILIAGGVLMLFIPGQGLLTILMGGVLLDYPGKYRLERKIVSVPKILSALNWLRSKRNAPPLILNED